MTSIEKFAISLTAVMCSGFLGFVFLEMQPSEDFVVTVEHSRSATPEEVKEEEPEEEIIVISPENPLNINLATQEELELLPNIGEKRASDIISWREEQGNFTAIEEIMLISGIGEGIFQDLMDLIWVEPPEEMVEESLMEEESQTLDPLDVFSEESAT